MRIEFIPIFERKQTLMKKKILTLCLVICLAATAVVGGTLAYFTDNDAKTNTFTIGDVNIHIDEWMKEGDEWVPYEDEQHLSPITQAKAPFNKLVETVNDGSEPAYIRTFVTCPKDMYDYLGLGFNSGENATVQKNDEGKNMYPVVWKDIGTFTINGEETSVFVCEYKGIVDVGESVLSLTKVWLYENLTNEQVEAFQLAGGAFKVEVRSEAIQSANLTYEEAMAELGAMDAAHMAKLFG